VPVEVGLHDLLGMLDEVLHEQVNTLLANLVERFACGPLDVPLADVVDVGSSRLPFRRRTIVTIAILLPRAAYRNGRSERVGTKQGCRAAAGR
jgi:hypothetical protein